MNKYHWAGLCALFIAWPTIAAGHYAQGLFSGLVAFALFLGVFWALAAVNRYIFFAVGSVLIALGYFYRGDIAGGLVIGVASFLLMSVANVFYDRVIRPWRDKQAAAKDAASKEKLTPLLVAAADGDDGEIERLLSSGSDVNECGANGETALIMAARNDRRSSVRLLLRAGAEINARTSGGNTARDIAKKFGHSVIAEILDEYEGGLAHDDRR